MTGLGRWLIALLAAVSGPAWAISSPAQAGPDYTVTWGWAKAPNWVRYELWEGVNGGAFVWIANTTTESFNVTGRTPATYNYRAKTCQRYNAGTPSEPHWMVACGFLTGQSTTQVLPPPAAPSFTGPTSDTDGAYTLSWGAVANATSYNVQENVNGGAWTTIQSSASLSVALSGKTNATGDLSGKTFLGHPPTRGDLPGTSTD